MLRLHHTKKGKRLRFIGLVFGLVIFLGPQARSQRTQVNGFIDVGAYYQNGQLNFNLGEQDIFIKSELNERFSFIGETIIRYAPENRSQFDIRIQRAILKYNYYGNHNLLLGKHNTPINYWNDTYYRGRLFWPTIEGLLVLSQGIIPQNTTGINFQGLNVGKLRFGYDLMIGNGIGSGDLVDNNRFKSVTAGVHIKPVQNLRIGATLYHDVISKGSILPGRPDSLNISQSNIRQNLLTASVSYFSKRYELIAESTTALNQSASIRPGLSDQNQSVSTFYVYAGLRIKDKVIPYVRFDKIRYRNDEVYFRNDDIQSFIAGLRYEINYLTVVKLEYQQLQRQSTVTTDKIAVQLAIGF